LLNTSATYIQLPYEVANSDELTIMMWIKWSNSTAWQRIFDFGNGINHYMFLTPSTGNVMRFAIKNGGDEQTVNCKTRLIMNQWKHVAVSIGREKTTIYIDGVEAASSTGITIKPSDIHPALNYLGRSQFPTDPYLTGIIDDARIYNYALDAEAIKEAMGQTDGINPTSLSTQHPTSHAYNLGGRRIHKTATGKDIQIIDRKLFIK
jgi:hypothetical protein